MTSYPTLNLTSARNVMNAFESGNQAINISEHVVVKGSGESIDSVLQSLHKAIKRESGTLREGALDAKLASIVHGYLSGCEIEILQDRDFWRYLSCYEFHNLVESRFPKNNREKNIEQKEVLSRWENFGAKVEDVKNSYMYRLYLAAELTYEEKATNPYHLLDEVTDVDIYRSHIIRVKSGDNPEYAKALLSWYANRKVWYKNNEKKLQISKLFRKYDKDPHRNHLRDIAKRTLRLRSNIIHEFLDRKELDHLIESEAVKSLKNIEKWGKSKTKSIQNKSKKSKSGKKIRK